MSEKPAWLTEAEWEKYRIRREHSLCIDCAYRGKPFKVTWHKGKEKTAVFECALHPGCYNTKYSISCGDWKHR